MIKHAAVVVHCRSLDQALAWLVDQLGFQLERISPADDPQLAEVKGHGVRCIVAVTQDAQPRVRLQLAAPLASLPALRERSAAGSHTLDIEFEWIDASPPLHIPAAEPALTIARATDQAWGVGRAGMRYRDLIPDRYGGRFIASHIHIPTAGPVPDYVHFHDIHFQLIFCKAGWVRVVYEDQGPPFVLQAGDCVLQPPRIRHRVLEASANLEVIEIGCPAVHDTYVEHTITLPTGKVETDRLFAGQRFVRHVATDATQSPWSWLQAPVCKVAVDTPDAPRAFDLGIAAATQGIASARVVTMSHATRTTSAAHDHDLVFLFVLKGRLSVTAADGRRDELREDDAISLPRGNAVALDVAEAAVFLEVICPRSASAAN